MQRTEVFESESCQRRSPTLLFTVTDEILAYIIIKVVRGLDVYIYQHYTVKTGKVYIQKIKNLNNNLLLTRVKKTSIGIEFT